MPGCAPAAALCSGVTWMLALRATRSDLGAALEQDAGRVLVAEERRVDGARVKPSADQARASSGSASSSSSSPRVRPTAAASNTSSAGFASSRTSTSSPLPL